MGLREMPPVLATKRRPQLLNLGRAHKVACGSCKIFPWHGVLEEDTNVSCDIVFDTSHADGANFIFCDNAGKRAVSRSMGEDWPLCLHVSGNFDGQAGAAK